VKNVISENSFKWCHFTLFSSWSQNYAKGFSNQWMSLSTCIYFSTMLWTLVTCRVGKGWYKIYQSTMVILGLKSINYCILSWTGWSSDFEHQLVQHLLLYIFAIHLHCYLMKSHSWNAKFLPDPQNKTFHFLNNNNKMSNCVLSISIMV